MPKSPPGVSGRWLQSRKLSGAFQPEGEQTFGSAQTILYQMVHVPPESPLVFSTVVAVPIYTGPLEFAGGHIFQTTGRRGGTFNTDYDITKETQKSLINFLRGIPGANFLSSAGETGKAEKNNFFNKRGWLYLLM